MVDHTGGKRECESERERERERENAKSVINQRYVRNGLGREADMDREGGIQLLTCVNMLTHVNMRMRTKRS